MTTNGNGEATALAVIESRAVPQEAYGLDMVRDLDGVFRLADALESATGFLPKWMTTRGECVAVLLAGRELGIPPMRALRVLYSIEGKIELAATEMPALLMRGGVRVEWIRSDNEVAHGRFTRAGHPPHEEIFSIADAQRAGLAGKGTWQKHPKLMLRARVASGAGRWWAPDLLGNCYTEGEISEALALPGSSGSADVVDLGRSLHETDPAPEGPDPLERAMSVLAACRSPGDLRQWLRAFGESIEREPDTQRKRDRWKAIGRSAGGLVPPVRKAELVDLFRVMREERVKLAAPARTQAESDEDEQRAIEEAERSEAQAEVIRDGEGDR